MRINHRHLCFFVVLAGLLIPGKLSGQRETRTIFLAVPKPVVQQGETVWYGVVLDNYLLREGKYPVLHGYIKDHTGDLIDHWVMRPDSGFFIGQHPFSESLVPGSYVLSVAIWNDSYSQVLEESDQMIHVLGGEDQTYYRFRDFTGALEAGGQSPGSESTPRQSICIQRQSEPALAFVAMQEWDAWRSWATLRAADLSTRYGYAMGVQLDSSIAGAWTVYDLQTMTSSSIDLQETGGALTVADFTGQKRIQLIGLLDNRVLDVKAIPMPDLLWKPADLIRLELPVETKHQLQDQEEKRALIGNIFGYQNPRHNPATQTISNSRYDDEYDLSKFLPFESLELFIHEVVLPLKLIRKRNIHSIRVLNADTKNWFEDAPVVMVNGILQPDLSPLFNIPYDQCLAIRLYRSLETTRQRFGPLARNGVIEIVTKPTYQAVEETLTLEGLTSNKTYQPAIPLGLNDETPVLIPVPMFGMARSNPVCYTHSDETGAFRYAEFRLQDRRLVIAVKDFVVR